MDLDALAKQCWEKFVAAVNGDTSSLPGMSDDPCPACKPGHVCRTPFCGRLTKQNLAKIEKIDQTLDRAIASWEEHEALTFHKLEK